MSQVTRRQLLSGAIGALGVAALGGCTSDGVDIEPGSEAVRRAESARRRPGQRLVKALLVPRAATIDLGGPTVQTWAYGDQIPGGELRANAGDRMFVTVRNDLPASTSVHWHGVALRNDMDGMPGVTQAPIRPGSSFTYDFTVPEPGTYFFHPHSGVQLDRGLYGVLIVDDPNEPGRYDADWTAVLDDWVDGMGATPDELLADLRNGSMSGDMHMGGTRMGGTQTGGAASTTGISRMTGSMTSPLLGGAGNIRYPTYLVNGRVPASPQVFTAKPADTVRIRLVNAGSDTAFRVALGGHRLTLTHSDGFPVRRATTDALLIGMGERFDVEVKLGDGVFPLVAMAEGKSGQALALIRTGSGPPPTATARPAELNRTVTLGADLQPVEAVTLSDRPIVRTHEVVLGGSMMRYRWTINGAAYPHGKPMPVAEGERVRLRLLNRTMMFHPFHLHGHTFAVSGDGPRKDTVIVRPMERLDVDFDADNPGQWMTHCHNVYHAETGMMAVLSYRA